MRDLEFNINARDRTAGAFDSAESRAKRFNDQLFGSIKAFDLAGVAAKAFAGAFTLTAIQNFGEVVRGVITQAADLVDLADKVGVATGDLQRLTYGFELAGIAAGDVDQILSQWSKRIGEAFTHGGRLADILKANGVSLTDSEGRLRSSVDLLRDYANLVAGAGSDQERMTLATEAFGRAGGAMVNALRDGADGFDQLMRAADDAGGVLEDEILRRAAEIDDEFGRMWRTFEIGSKSAILSAVSSISMMGRVYNEFAERRNAAMVGATIGGMFGDMPQATRGGRLPSHSDSRINAAFALPEEGDNAALSRQLRDRFCRRTVIPDSSDERGGRTKAAKEQADAFQRVIDKLNEERELLGLSSVEQRVLTEQRRAGVEATSEQGQAIARLVRAIDAEKTAMDESRRQMLEFQRSVETAFDAAGDAIMNIVDGSDKASTALAKLAINFALAATQAALFNSGPLAGLFGGSSLASGFQANTTLGAFLGYRASGGPVDPWASYVVGEKGPEILRMGPQGGHVVSNEDAFGRAPVNVYIQTPDVPSFAKSRGQVEASIARAVARGQRGL